MFVSPGALVFFHSPKLCMLRWRQTAGLWLMTPRWPASSATTMNSLQRRGTAPGYMLRWKSAPQLQQNRGVHWGLQEGARRHGWPYPHYNSVTTEGILGIHISEDLSWTTNTSSPVKKAHHHLFFLRTLKKCHLFTAVLVNFPRGVIRVSWPVMSLFGTRTTRWRTTRHCSGWWRQPSAVHRARSILKDSSHPVHELLPRLASGRRFKSLWT